VWPLLFNVLKIQSRITVLASLAKWKNPVEPRTPYLNVLGIAEFAAGNDKGAIEFFDLNTQSWGPGGPHMVVFQAAALANLEKKRRSAGSDIRTQPLSPELSLRAVAWKMAEKRSAPGPDN
jgi:hypothetical protein